MLWLSEQGRPAWLQPKPLKKTVFDVAIVDRISNPAKTQRTCGQTLFAAE